MIPLLAPNSRHSERLTKNLVLAALGASLCNASLAAAADAQIVLPAEQEAADQNRRERLERLQEGTQAPLELPLSDSAANVIRFPSLGSLVFDAQLAGYQAYVEAVGTPDILIVGSSRALQGIDPTELRYRLSGQGYDDLKVYNFSVNGATAQVVNFVVSELLPGDLPKVIVWGDGSRAFNDGRRDRTWESLAASPGYQAILRGEKPIVVLDDSALTSSVIVRSGVTLTLVEIAAPKTSVEEIDRLGFSAVGDRFDPAVYYREFAKVRGRYDGAYSPFVLEGRQADALDQLAAFVNQQGSRLIFVNLPLSGSYLDADRLYYENRFQNFLVAQSDRAGFEVIDLLTQWQEQPELFADPSHINQYGAAAIAQQLARDPVFLSTLEPAEFEPVELEPGLKPAGPEPSDSL